MGGDLRCDCTKKTKGRGAGNAGGKKSTRCWGRFEKRTERMAPGFEKGNGSGRKSTKKGNSKVDYKEDRRRPSDLGGSSKSHKTKNEKKDLKKY